MNSHDLLDICERLKLVSAHLCTPKLGEAASDAGLGVISLARCGCLHTHNSIKAGLRQTVGKLLSKLELVSKLDNDLKGLLPVAHFAGVNSSHIL